MQKKLLNKTADRKEENEQLVLAVVGPMASGKNLVSEVLEKKGFLAIDADRVAHASIEENKEKILETFQKDAEKAGLSLLAPDGSINRRHLGRILFANPSLLQKQEAIIHPHVDTKLNAFIDSHPEQNIVLNATLLYKTPVIKRCKAILYVKSPILFRFFRVIKRDSLPIKQIFHRFLAQKKLFSQYKNLNADILIVRNYRSKKCLEKQVFKRLKQIFNEGKQDYGRK